MAAKKELTLDEPEIKQEPVVDEVLTARRPQPKIEVQYGDPSVRLTIQQQYDEYDPEFVHTWERDESAQDLALMRRQGKEVVKDDEGDAVRDAMGDVLVRHNRKKFEHRIAAQRRQSLLNVAGVTDNMADDGQPTVDADLLQIANPKAPVQKSTNLKNLTPLELEED